MNTDISERYCWAIHIFSEAILNNSDTFRELIANNFTHSFSEFISNSYQTILHTFFQSSYQTVTKQYYTLFPEFISINSDTFRELLPNTLFRVHITQCILRELLSNNTTQSSYQTILKPLELLANSTIQYYFSKSFYQTKLTFSESYCHILQIFF